MRFRSRPLGPGVFIVAGLATALAGCSSSGSQGSLTTSSLAPRPQEPVYAAPRRTYPDGSTYGRPYTLPPQRTAQAPAHRQYVDPGTPTPRHMANHSQGASGIQTASIGASNRIEHPNYDPNARWQQPSPIVTGAAAPAPLNPGPHVIEVREGDTLYSLSRHHRVPLHDIVVANRLTSDRIDVGQTLVIPTRVR